MKIELVKTEQARTLYENCPLCGGAELLDLLEGDCTRHPLYQPALPATIQWRGCETCGHVFTDGYFTDESLELLISRSNPSQLPGPEAEKHRPIAGRIISRISQIRGQVGGRWLDVGIGDGALMTTAAEFGYETVGLDLRRECTEPLVELGYDARCATLEDLQGTEPFDVISMADSLEHMPFPREVMAQAHRLLSPDGVIFLSMPNLDTMAWKMFDATDTNPYWGELEHYHNFSREHLYWLLRRSGFEPCHYGISERYRSGMEVAAVRQEAS
jgi:protein O-GlcNAc transferase